ASRIEPSFVHGAQLRKASSCQDEGRSGTGALQAKPRIFARLVGAAATSLLAVCKSRCQLRSAGDIPRETDERVARSVQAWQVSLLTGQAGALRNRKYCRSLRGRGLRSPLGARGRCARWFARSWIMVVPPQPAIRSHASTIVDQFSRQAELFAQSPALHNDAALTLLVDAGAPQANDDVL